MPITSHSQSKWLSGIWISTDSGELLQWINSLNPGPILREKWKVLDSKHIGRRLVLLQRMIRQMPLRRQATRFTQGCLRAPSTYSVTLEADQDRGQVTVWEPWVKHWDKGKKL